MSAPRVSASSASVLSSPRRNRLWEQRSLHFQSEEFKGPGMCRRREGADLFPLRLRENKTIFPPVASALHRAAKKDNYSVDHVDL